MVYCNKDERNNFLDLLAGTELSSSDSEFNDPDMLGRILWMTSRKVKCSSFSCTVRYLTDTVRAVLSDFVAMAAANFRVVLLECDADSIKVVLDAIAVNHCALEALLVTPTNIGNVTVPRFFTSIGTILSNSASKITQLELHTLLNLASYIQEGMVFPALKEVYIRPVTDADVIMLAQSAPNLELIDLKHPRCSDIGLAAIARCCAHVETFNLWHSRAVVRVNEGLAAIAMCPKLRILCMSNCPNVTDNGLIAAVSRCTRLEELIVDSPLVTDASFVRLAHSASANTLTCLVLNNCTAVTGTGIVAVATHCTVLNTLTFYQATSLTIANIKLAIPHMKSVTCLGISQLPVDDETLQLIAEHIPLLWSRDITPAAEETLFTSTGLMHIALKCEKLHRLDMGTEHHHMHDLAIALWKKLRPELTFGNLHAW